MIRTKKELIKELKKTKKSALDKLMRWEVSEELLRKLVEENKNSSARVSRPSPYISYGT